MLPHPIVGAVVAVFAQPAFAHPGVPSNLGSLLDGFTHPLLGIDHILVMVAVGLWAALLSGRAVWLVPISFGMSIVGGFTLSLAGLILPVTEPAIAASVFVVGGIVAAAVRLPLAPSLLLVGLFGVLHGYPHGREVSEGAFAFGLGLVTATFLLLCAGIGLGRALCGQGLLLPRFAGGVVASIGLLLLGSFS